MLGHNVLRQLLHEGYRVSTVVRQHNALNLDGLSDEALSRVTVTQGSFLIPSILHKAVQGCEAIVNCCGITDMSLLRYEDYLPINYDVCKLLTTTLEQHDIPRLVHVSTANTIGYGSPLQAADETAPIQFPFSESHYARSKQAGEKILIDYALQHPERHIVVVNPGFMVGPYDMHESSGQLLLSAYHKPIMICTRGGKSFLHVRDAAHAIVQAIHHGTSGQRYLLTGQNMSLEAFFRLQAATLGYRQWLLTLPDGPALAVAKIGDLLRRCGLRTQLCTLNVRQLLVREYYDNNHATRDLHLPHTPIEEAITDFFAERSARRQPARRTARHHQE